MRNVQDFYLHASNYYETMLKSRESPSTEVFEALVNAVDKNHLVLDVGCGSGVVSNALARQTSGTIVGIDVSRKGVGLARNCAGRDPNSHFVQASAVNLPFPNDSFEIVFSTEVLEHIENPKGVVDEMIRVTTSNGIVVISTPSWVVGLGRKGMIPRLLSIGPKILLREIVGPSSNHVLSIMKATPILDDELWIPSLEGHPSDIDAVGFISARSLFCYLSRYGSIEKSSTYSTLRNYARGLENQSSFFNQVASILDRIPCMKYLGPGIFVILRKK